MPVHKPSTSAPTSAWLKSEKMYCTGRHKTGTYRTFAAAEIACVAKETCSAVYDQGCDGEGSFALCDLTPLGVSAQGSCAYKKPI